MHTFIVFVIGVAAGSAATLIYKSRAVMEYQKAVSVVKKVEADLRRKL